MMTTNRSRRKGLGQLLRLLERIGEYNSETLNVIIDTYSRIFDLIASMVRFDCFHHCLLLRTVVLFRLYLSA